MTLKSYLNMFTFINLILAVPSIRGKPSVDRCSAIAVVPIWPASLCGLLAVASRRLAAESRPQCRRPRNAALLHQLPITHVAHTHAPPPPHRYRGNVAVAAAAPPRRHRRPVGRPREGGEREGPGRQDDPSAAPAQMPAWSRPPAPACQQDTNRHLLAD